MPVLSKISEKLVSMEVNLYVFLYKHKRDFISEKLVSMEDNYILLIPTPLNGVFQKN